MLAVALTDIGLFVAFVGFFSTVRPFRFLGIRTRPRALVVAAAGAVITALGLAFPAPQTIVARPLSVLDRITPAYHFNEVHSITVRSTPERVYRAIKDVTANEIRLFQTLVWIRRFGRPLPEGILNAPAHRPLLDVATGTSFVMLADTPREVVVGTVVVAPAPRRMDRPPSAETFLELRDQKGHALAAMNFTITPAGDGTCIVETETRVFATDQSARRRFAAYWRIIYPGSALIRRMWLRAIRDRAEQPHFTNDDPRPHDPRPTTHDPRPTNHEPRTTNDRMIAALQGEQNATRYDSRGRGVPCTVAAALGRCADGTCPASPAL